MLIINDIFYYIRKIYYGMEDIIMNVGFISLGCSKNLIDTEVIIGKLKNENFNIVNKPEEADMIVINTCGFILDAKEEAINTILEMAEYKNKKCKYLVVMGCLVQRYYHDLIKALPEVDLFIKIEEYDKFLDKIKDLIELQKVDVNKNKKIEKISDIKPMPMFNSNEFCNRVVSTGENYAYLKIGEGCSNRCTYCAIPYIRGPFVSREKEDIITEAKMLANKGIRELIVIAQDTTKYGIDIYGKPMLAELLHEISKIDKIKWIRVLYLYPEGITKELIDEIAINNKICKYFDIPIQHISNRVLKLMNRRTSKENIENIIKNIKQKIPNAILRTSLIVGFPTETKEDFDELVQFVTEVKFDKLGVFKYSKEDGTPASRLKEQVHHNTKKFRYNKIMEIQQSISKQKLNSKIGTICEVLIEQISFDNKYYIGRTAQDVPEIDGLVYIKNNDKITNKMLNQFVSCKILDVNEYDVIAEIVN